jgi:hypothetical protein
MDVTCDACRLLEYLEISLVQIHSNGFVPTRRRQGDAARFGSRDATILYLAPVQLRGKATCLRYIQGTAQA